MEKINGQNVSGILIMNLKDKNLISIDVTVDPIQDKEKEVRITTKDITRFLIEEKNLNITQCVKSSVVTNTGDDTLHGTWIFQLMNQETNHLKQIEKETNSILDIDITSDVPLKEDSQKRKRARKLSSIIEIDEGKGDPESSV